MAKNKTDIQIQIEVLKKGSVNEKFLERFQQNLADLAKFKIDLGQNVNVNSLITNLLKGKLALQDFNKEYRNLQGNLTKGSSQFVKDNLGSIGNAFGKLRTSMKDMESTLRAINNTGGPLGLMREFYKGQELSGIMGQKGDVFSGSKKLISDLKGNYKDYENYVKSSSSSFQNELVRQAESTNQRLTKSGGMFGFDNKKSQKTLQEMKSFYEEQNRIVSNTLSKGFPTNWQKALTGESGYQQIIKPPQLTQFQQFMDLSKKNVEQARANIKEAKEWIRTNKNIGESFEGQKAKIASFIGENERVVAGLGKTRMSFLHLKEGLKGYVQGTKELLAIQARWYGARALLFAALELPYQAIKSNLELGKAVKQAGAAADLSSEQMESLRRQSIALSNEIPVGANEIAKSAFTFAQAGMDFETISQAIPLAGKMVVTTGEDMAVAVDALTVAFFAWKLQADDLPAAADKISAAMAASRMKVADLGTVFNYLATTAKTLNTNLNGLTSLQDTLTLAATLSQAGVKPSTIGTGLGNAITRLVKAAKDENDSLAKILTNRGISLKDIDPTKNRLVDVFKRLSDAPELTLADVFKGWELRAGRSVSAILNQASKGIEEMEARIAETGVLERMFKTSTLNVLDQLKILENKFKSIFQVDQGNEERFVGLIKNLQSLIDLIVKFRVEIAYLIGAYLGTLLVSTTMNSITTIVAGFTALKATIAGVIVQLGGLRAILASLGGLTIGIGVMITLFYIGKYVAEKRMAKEKEDLGALVSSMTHAELNALRKATSASGQEWSKKLQGMGLGVDERGALSKVAGAGLERVPQEDINKMVNKQLAENAMYGLPKDYKASKMIEPEIDRGGGTSTDTGSSKGGARAYQNSLYNAIKDGYRKRIDLLKEEAREETAILEQKHKLGEISSEDYYENSVKIARKYGDMQLKELEGLASAREKLEKEYQSDLARAKTPQKKQLVEEKYKNQLDDIRKEEKKIQNEILKEVIKAENERTIYIRKENLRRSENEIEVEKNKVDTILEINKIRREAESSEREYQYSKGRIAAVDFYSLERIKIEKETADEVEKINNELLSKISKYQATWANYPDESEEVKLAWEEVEKATEQAENQITIAVENGVVKRMDLRRKELEDVKQIYSERSFLGVISYSLEEVHKDFANTGENIRVTSETIFRGMGDSFKNLFTDVIKGELKDVGDYIVDFLTMIGEALADFLAKQVASGILGGILGLFPSLMPTSSGTSFSGNYSSGFGGFLQKRASGGYVGVNQAYLVGEKGEPEVFVPGSSGNIVPLGRGSSQPPVMVVNIENKTGSDVKATQSQPQFDGNRWVKTVMLELANRDPDVRRKYGVR